MINFEKQKAMLMDFFSCIFYENLILPFSNSKIIKEKQLNKRTIVKLLSEIFVLDKKENEG